MQSYYTIDNQGHITAFAPYKFDPAAIETTREIVRGYDGKLYFAGEEPTQPSPTPAERIAEIKAKLSELDTKYAPTPRTLQNAVTGDEIAVQMVSEKNAARDADEEVISLREELKELEPPLPTEPEDEEAAGEADSPETPEETEGADNA